MVEFGLKLEDNKVDRWSDQYIDYEKLKAVLKRAKASAEYRDELLKRAPPGVAVEVLRELKNRSVESAIREARNEIKPVNKEGEISDDDSATTADAVKVVELHDMNTKIASPFTETTPLLGDTKSVKRQNSWSSSISWGSGIKKVTNYLGLSDEKSLLLQAYDDADDKMNLFKKTYEHEVEKVKKFYDRKTDEISQRMEALAESADASGLISKKSSKKSSMVHRMTQRFEAMMNGGHVHVSSESTSTGLLDVDFEPTESLDDEDVGLCIGDQEKDEIIRNSDSIQRAITDIYRTSKLLCNYSIMNYTGFVKIAKKFNKAFPEKRGMFKKINCDDGKEAEDLAVKMELMYARWFSDGDIREAKAQMLSKKGDGLLMDWTQLRLGYRLGMCTILAMWVAWDCVWGQFARDEVTIGGRSAFPIFRACSGLLAWHWFWGMSVYVWTRYRINYIYLFEFDPRNVDTPIDIFNDAVDETFVFLACMLMYYKADAGDMPTDRIPPRAYPFFLILYTAKCIIFPWKQRSPLWFAIKEVIMAPFVSPTFFLTYVGDVFTSMVKVFQDILWTICFVLSGDFLLSEVDPEAGNFHTWTEKIWYKNIAVPLVCLMPLWIRFNQCLRRYFDTGNRMPHLANAFKYALSQSVTLFGAFHPLYLMHSRHEHTVSLSDDEYGREGHSDWFQIFWMGLFVVSSLYSFYWDVYMDWGLGRRKYGFLGPRLMFPRKSHYYAVICADLVLRFLWVLTLIPPQTGAKFEIPAYLTAISMIVELFRRTIWSFFRLEHEHRQNTEGFRRVNVVPLHFNTGHKHKYHERHWVGWKVLVEIIVVTSIVVAISAISIISAQKATHQVQLSNPTNHRKEL